MNMIPHSTSAQAFPRFDIHQTVLVSPNSPTLGDSSCDTRKYMHWQYSLQPGNALQIPIHELKRCNAAACRQHMWMQPDVQHPAQGCYNNDTASWTTGWKNARNTDGMNTHPHLIGEDISLLSGCVVGDCGVVHGSRRVLGR